MAQDSSTTCLTAATITGGYSRSTRYSICPQVCRLSRRSRVEELNSFSQTNDILLLLVYVMTTHKLQRPFSSPDWCPACLRPLSVPYLTYMYSPSTENVLSVRCLAAIIRSSGRELVNKAYRSLLHHLTTSTLHMMHRCPLRELAHPVP